MKKSLLFIVAVAASISGFAQTTDTLYNKSTHAQLDSCAGVPIPYTGGGYLTGMNAANWTGLAEAYQSVDLGVKINGVITTWYGTRGSDGTTFHVKVWDVDTITTITAVNATDSVTGFPGAEKASEASDISLITLNHAPTPYYNFQHNVITFTTPYYTSNSFFVGYTLDHPYTWGTNSDTLALLSINQPTGITVYPGHDDYYHSKGGYKMYYSRNAAYDPSTSQWVDLYWTTGYGGFLSIVPIVDVNTSVGQINRNNLTFFGNYPNPAINNTNVKFSLKHNTDVTIEVMDINGRVLNVINQSNIGSGEHTIAISTTALASGEYMYMIRTSEGDAFASKFTVAK